jgi:flavin reductase (DIM6/NTAB) family NADH-FMN oxidoreductase RutF
LFYEPRSNNHGLPRDPFKSLVVPRPIGWISTINADGVVNVAPYSHFNICSIEPHAVMFSAGSKQGRDRRKDSQRNAEDIGEFVVNMATFELREKMNETSAPLEPDVSEAVAADLKMIPSRIVRPPRVAESPIQLECKHLMTIALPCAVPMGERNSIVIGEVVGVHIADEALKNGIIDVEKLRPLARLGYMDYSFVESVFQMMRPK